MRNHRSHIDTPQPPTATAVVRGRPGAGRAPDAMRDRSGLVMHAPGIIRIIRQITANFGCSSLKPEPTFLVTLTCDTIDLLMGICSGS